MQAGEEPQKVLRACYFAHHANLCLETKANLVHLITEFSPFHSVHAVLAHFGCNRSAYCPESCKLPAEDRRRASYAKPKPNEDRRLSEEWLQFFKQRGITRPVLDRNRIAMSSWGALMFRYFRDKEHVNNKFRTLDKRFSQVAGAEKVCRLQQ